MTSSPPPHRPSTPNRRVVAGHVVVLVLAVGFGTMLVPVSAVGEPTFSHPFHLEQGAECVNCHDTKAQPSPMLDTSACADCHDQTPTYLLPTRIRRLRVAFPHTPHVEALGACETCHRAMADGTQVDGAPVVVQSQCTECHAERGVSVPESACVRCHGVDVSQEKPATHTAAWAQGRMHGLAADMSAVAGHGSDCTQCHGQQACTSCHMTRTPSDHNGLWRVRLHGEAAEWDPQRCAVCHETGACVGCHANNAPMTHNGAWLSTHGLVAGERNNERCLTCHSESFCANCHMGIAD